MQVAVILPIPLLESGIVPSTYHLCLTQLVLQHPSYRRYYHERSRAGDFVILDNSAHERGEGEEVEALKAAAELVKPSEIVLPDVLSDAHRTVLRSESAIPHLWVMGIPYMVVPQGRNFDEWRWCLDELLKLDPDTIGISKDFEVWDLWGLVPLIEYAAQFQKPLHLLGWGRRPALLSLYSKVGKDLIRGTDSAKPAVYAREGIRLPDNLDLIPPYPGRPADFFTVDGIDRETLEHNINVFREAAR